MNIFKTKKEIKSYLTAQNQQNKTIGFIPTMGALHKGHLSLIQEAKKKNDLVVVSIFINPTQFNNTSDFAKYPKTIENDTQLLNRVFCDVLFLPSADEIYNNNIASEKFDFEGLEDQMEGKFRQGHFDGVATVVKAFFEIINPDIAYFGQKDFQQLQIIKKMVKKYHLNTKIKGCPIFREADGLAMSSRNVRLSKEHRTAAPFIYKTLKEVRDKFNVKNATKATEWVENEFKKNTFLELEYFTIADEKTLESAESNESDKKYRAFIAVFAGEIRLIDNIQIQND
jgi:pantoate--beta-alanine ligase